MTLVRINIIACCSLIFCLALLTSRLVTAESDSSPFFPTWKLLKQADKVQYMAGYIHAWHDANRTLGIAAQYVEDQPDKAADSLKRLQSIYDFSTLRPDTLVREIDAFYADNKKQEAPLSQAITAARARLR